LNTKIKQLEQDARRGPSGGAAADVTTEVSGLVRNWKPV
jgi:hypothetical protein